MADEIKKPKPIGDPAPNIKKPAPAPSSAPKQQMGPKEKAQHLKGAKVQPGSPYASESTPVGIQKGKFESDKHANKRLNKMFNETNQPSLGVWGDKKKNNPMAGPDSVKFNPKLKFNPTEGQLKQAKLNKLSKPKIDPVRQKIMDQGFKPSNYSPARKPNEGEDRTSYIKNLMNEGYNKDDALGWGSSYFDDMKEHEQMGKDFEKTEKFAKAINQESEDKSVSDWDVNNEPGSGAVTKELEDFARDYLTKAGGLSDEYIEKTVQGLRGDSRKADFYKQKMKEAYERKQASGLFGTDLEDAQAPTDEERAKWQTEDDNRDQELMKKYGWDALPVGSENMSEEEIVNEMNKDKVFTDSHGIQWKKNPDKGDGKNYGYSRVDNPSITSNIPADTGAEPEKGWNAEQTNETDERSKASELFGTDLKNNQSFVNEKTKEWLKLQYGDRKAEEIIKDWQNIPHMAKMFDQMAEGWNGIKDFNELLTDDWNKTEISQKSDQELFDMHDKIVHSMIPFSEERQKLLGAIEQEINKRHPIDWDELENE